MWKRELAVHLVADRSAIAVGRQRDDHNLVVEALCLALKKDHHTLRLPVLQ